MQEVHTDSRFHARPHPLGPPLPVASFLSAQPFLAHVAIEERAARMAAKEMTTARKRKASAILQQLAEDPGLPKAPGGADLSLANFVSLHTLVKDKCSTPDSEDLLRTLTFLALVNLYRIRTDQYISRR